jgi:hypothetical protein
LTKEKLESILNEAYNEGYRDGKNNNGYYYGITTTPYVSSTRDSDIAYLSSTTPSLSVNATEIARGKVASSATIDCCINANNGITADILEGKAKNAIMVEYVEAANEA